MITINKSYVLLVGMFAISDEFQCLLLVMLRYAKIKEILSKRDTKHYIQWNLLNIPRKHGLSFMAEFRYIFVTIWYFLMHNLGYVNVLWNSYEKGYKALYSMKFAHYKTQI